MIGYKVFNNNDIKNKKYKIGKAYSRKGKKKSFLGYQYYKSLLQAINHCDINQTIYKVDVGSVVTKKIDFYISDEMRIIEKVSLKEMSEVISKDGLEEEYMIVKRKIY